MNTTFDILLNTFDEIGIAQHIYMFSLPTIDDDLKRDITTFHFIWNIIQNVYIPKLLQQNDSLHSIYMYVLQEILFIQKKTSETLLRDKTWLLNKMKYMILKMKRSSRLILMKKLGLLSI
tara:strand:+ start:375 stop:734 length:360 start_codon:yes stop_codon:yes gene_type:complete